MQRLLYFFLLVAIFPRFAYSQDANRDMRQVNLTIATWNIGHFSSGVKPFSTIKGEILSKKANEFTAVVKDSLATDILCFNEYNETLGEDENGIIHFTKGYIPNDYIASIEGPLMGYSSNAIFSRFKMKNVKKHSFECTMPFVGELPRSANYYWLSCDLYVQGSKIKVVCAHTISSHGALCSAMNVEIINKCDGYDKVILCGDWNTLDYTIFKQAGYELANKGDLKTYPKKAYPLDNIMVKGLKIRDVRVIKTNVSDHYPLTCKIIAN